MKRLSKLSYLKFFLSLLFLFVLIFNFDIANTTKYDAYGDAAGFLDLGVSLAEYQKYGSTDFSAEGGLLKAFEENKIESGTNEYAGNSTWRPPVWPFLIAGIFLIFGYNLTYLLVFKFLLHVIGTFIFYKTLKLLKFKEVLIIIGAFLYGIHPAWQLYSRVFLSEPITLFFITLWVYLFLRFEHGKITWWPQAIAAGILILSHPYFIFLPFSVWLVLILKKEFSFRLFVISSFVCASMVSVWIIRNFIVLDTNEIVLTTSSGAVMAKGWNGEVMENHTNTQGDLANEGLVFQNSPYSDNASLNEVQRMKLYKDASLYFMKSNPEKIVPIIGTKLKSAFNPFPETPKPGVLETGRWLFQFLALLSLIYFLFFSNNKPIKSLVIGLILSTIGITILTYSGFRFRMPQAGLELLFLLCVINSLWLKDQKKSLV